MTLPPPTVRRLALVKYMVREGVEQSRRPSPVFVTALLTLHDAVELFLHLACDQHEVEPKDKTFMGYFTALNAVGPVGRQGMDRLNKARVAFKHHGNLPHDDDMEFFRASVTTFFDENTPTLFGVTFSEISLTAMVGCVKAREHLDAAEAQWRDGRRQDARGSLAFAYNELLWDYMERNREPRLRRPPFDLGPSFTFLGASKLGVEGRLKDFVEAVEESITRMREAMEVTLLGFDYRKYAEFKALTPHVNRTMSGRLQWVSWGPSELTQEGYDRCLSFIIEAALKLQEFDFAFASARAQNGGRNDPEPGGPTGAGAGP